MAITLNDFLNPLMAPNTQIVLKDTEEVTICKIFADSVENLDANLLARTVYSWDIIRNNLLYIYLDAIEEEKDTSVAVTGVELSNSTLDLNVDDSVSLVATVLPSDATNKNVTWVSSDETIVTVDDGTVTAVSEGTATIIVTTTDGGYTETCEITVTAVIQEISVTGVTLSANTLDLVVGGESLQLIATVEPENATNQEVTWEISDDTIASVADGLVIPISEGSATITVTTADGEFTDTCIITVSASGD